MQQGSPAIADNPCNAVASVPWLLYEQHSLAGDTCSNTGNHILSTVKLA